jgi:hypothetical protein
VVRETSTSEKFKAFLGIDATPKPDPAIKAAS